MFRNRQAFVSHLPVGAAFIGLVLVTTMALLRKPLPPEVAPLAWLIPLALYDLRKREVPNIAFVAAPCALAALAAALRGDWALGALTVVGVAASERRHLPGRWGVVTFATVLVACAALLILTPFERSPGAVAIIGFWLAYELGWWAGADALAAMTLALMWPDIQLLVALAAAHMVVAIFLYRGRVMAFPRWLSSKDLEQVGVAGMPAIALGAAIYAAWQWWLA